MSGRKVFVSYKFWDDDVMPINYSAKSPVRSYVDWIEEKFDSRSNHIYKGEHDDEDLTGKSDEYIWEHLKDKIYDSSVTIVLISPNMRRSHTPEKAQWIPWEISYSLRETTRKDRTSHRNAVLGVVLPDSHGQYGYYNSDFRLFNILGMNINRGYIPVVFWKEFEDNLDKCINEAIQAKERERNPACTAV